MSASNNQQYSFSENDRLFFDTNIWFFIYGPQSSSDINRQRIYSSAFRDIISRNCKIFIDVLVLAEFINRMARFSFDLWCEENQLSINYKDFRSMDVYKPIVFEIEKTAQMILVDSIPIESGFSQMDISSILKTLQNGQQDFNDLSIVNTCQINHLKLITDDSDFKSTNIEILTSNLKLLRS
ncbi:MAG: PIN domain-containing protein [Flexilinea sp.]